MKKIFFTLLTFLPLTIQAQVSLSVQLPAGGMVQRDQLWNLVVINNTAATIETTILLTLQDMNTGQLLLSASTNNVSVPRGVKMLAAKDVQPIQYSYNGPDLQAAYLPLGTYNACYTVSKIEGEATVPAATECVRINIQPLSPPLLNQPADNSVIKTPYPQFSWIPPGPVDMFTDLTYDVTVVEVLEGQSITEAIFNNIPLFSKTYIRTPFESYPSSQSPLVPGRKYAWQVVARNGMNYAAQTEIWSFSMAVDSVKVDKKIVSYLLLNDDNAGVNLLNERQLYIKYYSLSDEQEINFRFMTSDRKVVQEVRQKIVYGDNFLEFKLNNRLEEDKVYMLELDVPQQRKPRIQFIIKKSNPYN